MPLLNPKLARLQAALPRIFKFRLSRIPVILLFLFSGWAFYRYLSDPTNFDIFDALGLYAEEDYYDPHLYEWHKYPGAARAGDHQDHAAHSEGKRPVDSPKSGSIGPGMDEIGQHHAQDGYVNYTSGDGLVRGWTLQGRNKKNVGKRLTHPIEELMRDNKQRWEDLLKRQSRSLEQAVREYKRRYGRLPPKGFDKWYKYCVDNNVKIIDDVSRGRVTCWSRVTSRLILLGLLDQSMTKSTTMSNPSSRSRRPCSTTVSVLSLKLHSPSERPPPAL
jgi:hypothetical protein